MKLLHAQYSFIPPGAKGGKLASVILLAKERDREAINSGRKAVERAYFTRYCELPPTPIGDFSITDLSNVNFDGEPEIVGVWMAP